MLNILSRLKRKVWGLLALNKSLSNLENALNYPHDHVEVSTCLDELSESKRSVVDGSSPITSNVSVSDLKARYGYLNSRNRFFDSFQCYLEILKRESRWFGVFKPAGLRKYYMARFLLSSESGELNNKDWRKLLRIYRYYEGYNKKFSKKVKGKCIAIVGGAPSEALNGDEIDQCDLVARININSTKSFNSEIVGERTDIVYIRGERGALIIKDPDSYFGDADDGQFYRLKVKKHSEQMQSDNNLTLSLSFNDVFDYGHLNAVQSAMLDLFVHGATSVKIFNVDFNLSGAGFAGYRPTSLKEVNFEKIFVAHPPHPQFHLCKNLYTLNQLDGDSKFSEIVSGSLEGFVKKCDKRWSIEN